MRLRREQNETDYSPALRAKSTLPFLRQTLEAFNQGHLAAATAVQLLNVSRAHLFRLRAAWLQPPATSSLQLSGGDHRADCPHDVQQFLQAFLPLLVSAPAPTPASWISIWPFTWAVASTPTTRSTSWAEAGLSAPPPDTP